ncbi:hypothetical protein [Listeria valentina]|uniref:hypothetical protein n=1 Tax=Listeria valentina TaxID=2705293 RepID=UPI001431C547|nr:hypothetical protein [Listeria valentina]
MNIKKFIVATIIFLGLVISPFTHNVNTETVLAANWGKTKTVTSYLSKAQIKRRIGNQTTIAAVTGPIASALGATAGAKVKTALGKGAAAFAISSTISLVNAGAKKEKKKLQGYLKKLKLVKLRELKLNKNISTVI